MRRLASIYIDVPSLRPGTLGAYALAAVLALGALVARVALDPHVHGAQYVTVHPAVITATLISGLGAGLLCGAISVAGILFFILPPRFSFGFAVPGDELGFLLFGLVVLAEVTIAAAMRFNVERYRELSRTLEQRVEDRTAEVTRRSRELTETNRRLREADNVFRAMYDHGGIFIALLNLEGMVIDANSAWIERLGFVRADNIGKPFWEGGWWRVSPEVEEWIRNKVGQAVAGEPCRGESSYVTGYREERITDIAMTPIKDDAGRVVFVCVNGMDVTERARQYRATFENAAVGIAHFSNNLKWVRVNGALCHMVGYAAHELVSRPVLDLIHPDYREAVLAAIERLRNGNIDSSDAERRYLRKDGATVWVRAAVIAVRRSDGSIDHFVGVFQDISARKQAEELLQHQADLLNESHDAIFTLHIDDRGIVYWSRGAEKLYGYTATEAKGRRAHELLQTRATIPIEDIDARVVSEGSWYGELTHITRNGREIVVDGSIVRVSYGGETFALETNRDITERKHAEERIELLMHESHHRIKNILGLVQAVARQTAAREPEHFVERFTERVHALAANHDLLIESQWQGADVDDLVRVQLAHFADLVGSRIAVRGPRLRLNAAAAQAVGLAVHELATNASKYGALSTDSGCVDVDWRSDARSFAISWTERGGPPVHPPDRRGFGSTVVEAMAKRTVGGEVEVDYAPSGFEWHLTCPTANALEATADIHES
jgi:PAS domain S-box-containing protein